MTDQEIRDLIAEVDEAEALDMEDTTREERYWMRRARELAVIVSKMRGQ